MKQYLIRHEQLVARPLNEVFAFFEKPRNMVLITPPTMKFVCLTPHPIALRNGTIIEYSVRVFGYRIHWTAIITDYLPPYKFVDVQLRGPYAFWHHTHSFDESSRGTLIVDEVRYVLPFGILGRLAHALFVKRKIEKIFKYRAEIVSSTFGETAGTVRS